MTSKSPGATPWPVIATRAGFMPVVLAPMNFEALYVQRMQQAQAAQVDAPAGHA